MRRADRLFQIVQFLRGRRLSTAAFLAGRLGVSLRTVYRDVRDLSLSGVPIEGEAGVGYRLRALAVTAPARLASLPGVPTTAEAGLLGIEAIVWNGIFVPAGTPQPVIQVLHRELVRAYNAAEIKGQVVNTGGYVAADSPEEFAAFVRAENAKWSKVAREAGIKAEQR